jgi:hypothetical protein
MIGAAPQGEITYYNDIQCGNGPANTFIDEAECPGEVGAGAEGCLRKGPEWVWPFPPEQFSQDTQCRKCALKP